jgi:hypothetical protein
MGGFFRRYSGFGGVGELVFSVAGDLVPLIAVTRHAFRNAGARHATSFDCSEIESNWTFLAKLATKLVAKSDPSIRWLFT